MSWILALLIGLMAGYGAVEGGEAGLPVAVLALVALPVLYYRQGRLPDIGLLFLGAGALPTLLLGRVLLDSLLDPGVGAVPGTWPAFGVALLLVIVGTAIFVATLARGRRGST